MQDHWEQVEALFQEALRQEGTARAALFEDDLVPAHVREEVEALLAADAEPLSLLETQQHAAAGVGLFEDALRSTAGAAPDHVGPYRLIRELGRGGMGTVYLAERTDVGKQVAVKLIRDPLAPSHTLDRFLLERRILARLEHPYIARLLDAGMTEARLPYFAMEYVQGEPITHHCERHGLGVRARLRLFKAVCEAAQYAHQNLVIHRDLKPSNIFVDADGQVKLLDFGIAKLTEDEAGEVLTQTGMRPMTPRYAAPEQVQGEAVTTATDVYALGLLLYELLTGGPPYDLDDHSLGEMARVICEAEPLRPSVRVRRREAAEEASTEAVAAEETVLSAAPDASWRTLSGDLDTICLKALEKDPSHRYTTAKALRDDIERYLNGLPIEARPHTRGYRLRKYAHRHRRSLATAALALSLLLTLSAAFVLRLAHERDRARQAAATAEQVSAFLADLFDAADPYAEAQADSLTARTLLARGANRIDRELADQPEIQAQLLERIGLVSQNLSLYGQADTLLQQALSVQQHLKGGAHPDVGRLLNRLGYLRLEQGRYDEADTLLREALALHRRAFGEIHAATAESHKLLGQVEREKGDLEAAERRQWQVLRLQRQVHGAVHFEVAEAMSNLAGLLRKRGDLATADSLYREALVQVEQVRGSTHPHVAELLGNLAGVMRDQGQFEAAEALFRRALHINREAFGDEHAAVVVALNNLAVCLMNRGAYAKAEAYLGEALVITKKLRGGTHPLVAHFQGNLASVLRHQEQHRAAVAQLEEALGILRLHFPEDHPQVAWAEGTMAISLTALGRFAEAEALLLRSHPVYEATYGAAAPSTQASLNRLINLYEKWGKPALADHWRKQKQP